MKACRYFTKPWSRTLRWAVAIGAAAALAACGGGGSSTTGAQGSLRVALTDAPSCGYDHVWVTVEKVRVHQISTAADSEGGWSELAISPARRIDLLTLTNGALEELGTLPLSAGKYSQIRLVLASNGGTGTATVANAVQPTGGDVIPLSTPSAQQSGLKLQAHFDVEADRMADVVLDFDACKSIVRAGNSGSFNLKPVIAVVPRVAAGVEGHVAANLPLGGTTVAAQQNGVTIRSTTPDANGRFSIPFLPAGTYSIVVTAEGHATTVVTGVVVADTMTVISGADAPIAPPVSSMADVTGTVSVTPEADPAVSGIPLSAVMTDAAVRAVQPLTGGEAIEVSSRPVDGVLGTYRLRVPVAPPELAAYSAHARLAFAKDSEAAAGYAIEVVLPPSQAMDVADDGAIANLSWES